MTGLVALTGATGFIGNALLNSFAKSETKIRALSRQARSSSKFVDWVMGDLDSPQALQNLVDDADVIIHCAGIVRGKSNDEFLNINDGGTSNLIEACKRQKGNRRFLLISSLAARQPELSWYAYSKSMAEQTLNNHGSSMSCTVFRPTAVYGPGDKEIRPLLRSMKMGVLPVPGTVSRFSLIHINDLVSAITRWAELPSPLRGIYELDDGTPGGYNWATLIELANQIWGRSVIKIPIPVLLLGILATTNLGLARLFHYSPMLTPGKVREITHPDWTCDNTALSQALDWHPTIKLADAMQNSSLLQL